MSNNDFQEQLSQLQREIAEQAKKIPVPSRFIVEDLTNKVIVIDVTTGRMSEVQLFAFGNVRRVLNDLFGEQE